jgi:hypothetical protein
VSGGVTNVLAGATNATYTTAPVLDGNSGTGYFVVVSNSLNTVASTTAILTAGHLLASSGYLRNDQYTNLTGGLNILVSQIYPASAFTAGTVPSRTEYLSVFDGNQNLPANSGQRIYGWFTPAASGDYVFYMTADDAGALWLSTDSGPVNVYQIAQSQAWMLDRDWTCQDTNSQEYTSYFSTGEWRSDQFGLGGGLNSIAGAGAGWSQYPGFNGGDGGIPLVAGTKYYIELDTYQVGGGQAAAVTYKLAGNADPGSNSVSLLVGNNISTLVPDTVLPAPHPVIGNITVSGSQVIINGSNGLVNAVYNVLSSTNLTTPLASWTVAAPQLFDLNGNFHSTNAVVPGVPQTFYRLQQKQ